MSFFTSGTNSQSTVEQMVVPVPLCWFHRQEHADSHHSSWRNPLHVFFHGQDGVPRGHCERFRRHDGVPLGHCVPSVDRTEFHVDHCHVMCSSREPDCACCTRKTGPREVRRGDRFAVEMHVVLVKCLRIQLFMVPGCAVACSVHAVQEGKHKELSVIGNVSLQRWTT